MKDFSHWGTKTKVYPEKNYRAIWNNLKTVRIGKGQAEKLDYGKQEFYDIGIGTKCTTGNCPWCYVAASKNGEYYEDISETWKKWIEPMELNDRPLQIAAGSTCEPTEHSEFLKFIKTVHETGVVPNYTTNGVLLAEDNAYANNLLDFTEEYCAGVALSCNKHLEEQWKTALEKLKLIDIHINLHYIIKDKKSVDEFMKIYDKYHEDVLYFVVLPLMPQGRAENMKGMTREVWDYFEKKLSKLKDYNIAFGAHMYEYLKDNETIKTYHYPPESFSANVLLKKDEVVITPSSFDLTPAKIIRL